VIISKRLEKLKHNPLNGKRFDLILK